MERPVKPLTLHTMEAAWRPNPLKAAILLDLLEVPYEVKKWVTGSGSDGVEGPNFTKLNPYGRTPALEDNNNGVVVWESGAVLEYILRLYDPENLLGPGPTAQDRASFDEWNQVLLTGLAPAMGELAYFRPKSHEDAVQHFEEQIYRSLAVIDKHLGRTGNFFQEGKFTAVDVNFYCWLVLWELLGLQITSYPKVQRWLQECQAVPGIGESVKNIEHGRSARTEK